MPLPASVPKHFLGVYKDVDGMVVPDYFTLEALSKLIGYSTEELRQDGFLENLYVDGPDCRTAFFHEARQTGKSKVQHCIRTNYGRILLEILCIFKNGFYRVLFKLLHHDNSAEYAVV